MHLLEDCHFFIQLSVYPTTIEFKMPEKKMLGYYVYELQNSINFSNKDIFIQKVTNFNNMRNNVVHKMTKNNIAEQDVLLSHIKNAFDEIFALYDSIRDDFQVTFHGFQKNDFIDYIDEDKSEN